MIQPLIVLARLRVQAEGTGISETVSAVSEWLAEHELLTQLGALVLLALLAYAVDRVAKRVLLAVVRRVVKGTAFQWDDVLQRHRVFERLAHFAPAIAVHYAIQLVPGLSEGFTAVVQRGVVAAMVLIGMFAAGAALSATNEIYTASRFADGRPIKGYIQIGKMVLYLVGGIIAIATLLGRSPAVLLGGIGAMTAVLLIVFRDTILSFVASLQISNYDIMRVGDWIEMPQYGADGDVIDIGLHTIKVQNWDKTIVAIPTHKFLTDSFKNWRGMRESGGRRIKRALNIDVNSIRFLTEREIERFENFALLREYIREKKRELEEYNASVEDAGIVANARRLTNIGTFRAYVVNYLRQHPKVHKGMTLMVRQLEPTPEGLPLQLYLFTADTNWVNYEAIQSDIFDHIIAIVPEFGLRAFQTPSGRDFEKALGGDAARKPM